MPEVPHILVAGLTGVISGFLVSIPVGPINLTIINEGARRGFTWAALIGLGAVVMETIYCGIAFLGFATFFEHKVVRAVMELLSFLLMLYLGFKYLMARTIEEHSASADRIEQKLHPRSAFTTGFVRVLGNPGVLLLWLTLTAVFISHEWVSSRNSEKFACILGVALGGATWFLTLSYAVSLGHSKLSHKTLLKMEHGSGLFLLGIAIVIGIRIVWLLARSGRM